MRRRPWDARDHLKVLGISKLLESLGFRVWGLGFRVWGFGFRGLGVWGLGFRGLGFGVFRVWGVSGFRVWDCLRAS